MYGSIRKSRLGADENLQLGKRGLGGGTEGKVIRSGGGYPARKSVFKGKFQESIKASARKRKSPQETRRIGLKNDER